jgi:hypothetical protein
MHLTFFSKKNQKQETIEVEKTEDGWYIQHDSYYGHCDKAGAPHLYRCIEENYAEYPPAFGDALAELWDAVEGGQLAEDEIQKRLDQFSKWVMYYTIKHSPELHWAQNSGG